MIKPEAAGPCPLRRRPSVMPGKSRKYLQIFGSGSPHRRGAAGTCAAEVPMGSHVPAARLAAAVSSVLALSMLVPLGGGTAASAATAGSLQAAFDNVGITAAVTASAGNFDGIGDSFDAAGLARDALAPGQSLLHDGLRIDWPDVPPGQPDNVVADGQTDRGQRDRQRARRGRRVRLRVHQRDVHHRLRGRQHQHGHRHVRRLGGHQRRPGHRPAGHHGGLEPGRDHPGQPVLRGHPADRGRSRSPR